MRIIFRTLGIVASCFFILVFVTLSVKFIRRAWFGGGTSSAHVSVYEIDGILLSSKDTIEAIQEIVDEGTARALVIRVNSPGGLVAPSQEIYDKLIQVDKKIPVIVSMGSVAASGGYYLALGGRKIFANPGTLTASIGVIMEFLNTEKLYTWAKIERFSLTAGRLKDAGSPLRRMTPEEREYFSRLLTEIHTEFRSTVQKRRKLTDAELDQVADGRVMSGSQAFKAKLVDSLGGIEDAIAEAKKAAALPDSAPVLYEEPEEGLLRSLLLGKDSQSRSLTRGLESLVSQFTPSASAYRILWQAPIGE